MSSKPVERAGGPGRWRPPLLGTVLLLCWLALWVAEARSAEPVFARVGEVAIPMKDYEQAYAVAARNKFYHGQPPEAEVARLQREVGESLVNQVLLLKEARRRGLQPDHAAVRREIEGYEARYQGSAMWQQNKATMLPPLKKKLEEHTMLDRLQASVRQVPAPDERQVEAYYEQHKDKFTEPEQVHLSMILLRVDPSSPQAKWNGAIDEGAAIARRLRSGADFAALAHLHSGDASADKGGDMGYLHRGMLPEPAQLAVDKLQVGAISDPVQLLEGVAVFRLDDRKRPKVNPLAAVRQRAQDLLQRDLADQAWAALLGKLRREQNVRIDESRYLQLAQAGASPTAVGATVAK